MTVSTTGSSAQFYPNGATTHFPFRFRFFQNSDLKVFWQDLTGNIELLRLNSDYTVQGAGAEDGGAIDTTGAPLPNGTLVVSRVMVATQLTSFRNQGEFFAEIHEDAFDRLIMLVQQTIDSQGRGLTIPPTDPLDINLELPSSATRAGKLLAFDDLGQPAASNLTLAQLEQQPALAMEAAEAAIAAADAAGVSAGNSAASASSANASKNAAAGSASAAATSAQAAADAGLQLGMSTWGHRPQPFKGFGLDDGQELLKSLYPDFVAAMAAGLVATTSEATWQADPYQRGCFVLNSATPGYFRMRDMNGKSPGSVGPLFLRGGTGGTSSGTIVQDQFQGHKFDWMQSGSSTGGTTLASINVTPTGLDTGAFYPKSPIGKIITDGANGTPRFGAETYPTHATGAWMTRLFGVITPLGSAEAASLATAYASLASRLAVVEAVPRVRRWRSGTLAVTSNTATFSHGLGVTPDDGWVYWTLVVAAGGWPVGQVFKQPLVNLLNTASGTYGHQVTSLAASTFTVNYAQLGPIMLSTAGVATVLQAAFQVELFTLGFQP